MTSQREFAIDHRGRRYSVSGLLQYGGEDLVLMLHGLGCGKLTFADAFSHRALRSYSLCAIDLPGHGDSPRLDETTIEAYAEIVLGVARTLDAPRVHLVCHSMGGAVGLLAAQHLRGMVSFVSVEGNMVAGDCGLISRQIASQPIAAFQATGFDAFLSTLRRSGEQDAIAWAKWCSAADPVAVHAAARSLVEWSDCGKLLSMFLDLPYKAYVYGSRSQLGHMLPNLFGVSTRAVMAAGHFPMVDRPDEFYRLLGEELEPAPAMV